MIRGAVLSAVIGMSTSMAASCTDDGGPRLISVTPAAAPRGARVTIEGERLCGERGHCATAAGAIRIGASASVVQATVLDYGDRAAEIEIPEVTPIGKTELIVTVNELASNALDFEVIAGARD